MEKGINLELTEEMITNLELNEDSLIECYYEDGFLRIRVIDEDLMSDEAEDDDCDDCCDCDGCCRCKDCCDCSAEYEDAAEEMENFCEHCHSDFSKGCNDGILLGQAIILEQIMMSLTECMEKVQEKMLEKMNQ